MANLFEKFGLVERRDAEPQIPDYDLDVDYAEDDAEDLPEVDTDGLSQENLISDIYEKNGCTDTSKSIFKAEEISKSLPTTMPTDAKKASVIGILSSFGLTAEALETDAEERISVLKAAGVQINADNTEIIDDNKRRIEEAKILIADCERTIAEHEKVMADSTDMIEAEIKRIDALRNFIGGEQK